METPGRHIDIPLTDEQARKLNWLARQAGLSPEEYLSMVINHVDNVDTRRWVVDHSRGWSREDLYERPSLLNWQKPWLDEEPLT